MEDTVTARQCVMEIWRHSKFGLLWSKLLNQNILWLIDTNNNRATLSNQWAAQSTVALTEPLLNILLKEWNSFEWLHLIKSKDDSCVLIYYQSFIELRRQGNDALLSILWESI